MFRSVLFHKKILFPSILTAPGFLYMKQSNHNDDLDGQITSLIEQEMLLYNIPGISISISQAKSNGKCNTIYANGFGYADIEQRSPATPNTVYRIASISKCLTAVLLGILVQRNQLQWTDQIQQFLPSFPLLPVEKQDSKTLFPINIQQLASHTSGIRHYKNKEFFSSVHYKTIEDAINHFHQDPLKHSPSSSYLYSTYNYTILSGVIEHICKKPFLQVLQEELLNPLQLNNTMADVNETIIPFKSRFYCKKHIKEEKQDDEAKDEFISSHLVNCPHVNVSNKWAGGGLLSTVQDVSKFGCFLLHASHGTNSLLRKEILEYMWTPIQNNYGIGFVMKEEFINQQKHKLVYHTGGAVGCSSIMLLDTNTNICIAMACNLHNFRTYACVGEQV